MRRMLSSVFIVTDRRLKALIFLGLWASYSFIGPGEQVENQNTVSRMGLVFSLLDNRSLQIDDFADFTTDRALSDGHYYSDKAPGMSFMALPLVGLAEAGAGSFDIPHDPIIDEPGDYSDLSPFYDGAVRFSCIFTSALFTAFAGASLFSLARHWQASREASLFGALVFGLATPAFGWATVFFGHACAGACLFMAYAASTRLGPVIMQKPACLQKGLFIGGLLSLTVLIEFTCVPAVMIIGCFALWQILNMDDGRRWFIIAGMVFPALCAAIICALYNYEAFGSVIAIGYRNVDGYDGMKQGFLGISWPNVKILGELVYGMHRGILWISPILVLAPLAWVTAFRTWRTVPAMILVIVPVLFLLINSGYFYWDGGASTGPRHIVPCLPFIATGFATLWNRWPRLRLLLGMIWTFSALMTLVCASVTITCPEDIPDELFDYIWPHFMKGDLHNLLSNTVIQGKATLLAVPLIWTVVSLIVFGSLRNNRNNAAAT